MGHHASVRVVPLPDYVHSWKDPPSKIYQIPSCFWFYPFILCLFVSWFMSITGAKSRQGVQLPRSNQAGEQQEKNLESEEKEEDYK